jgi:formylglycine-generating enzyme required for sulfatase activity/energy-coupling factor transporter ATP-binding protein EcfA2
LVRDCQYLPVTPFGGDHTGDLEIPLDQVYIALDTQSKRDWIDEKEKERYFEENNINKYAYLPSFMSEYSQRPIAAIEAANKQSRMVFLGDPGSGKSTFIKKVAGMAAHGWHNEHAQTPINGRLFPLIIILRDITPQLHPLKNRHVSQQESDCLAVFESAVEKTLSNYGIEDFRAAFLQIVKQRDCLMIFDGMDEVPQDLRPMARSWIETIVRHYQPQKVIITCRIRSYFEEAVLKDYPVYTLSPFTRKQIQDFTLAWYRTKRDLSSQQQEERAADFNSRVNADKNILEMATNPMLLTQMAVLHQRDTKLPDKRVKLYEEVVSLLLYRWQDYREIRTPISDKLQSLLREGTTIRLAMEYLAFATHRLAKGDLQAADLPREVALELLQSDDYLGSWGLAEEFLAYLDQRSGLLHGRGGRMQKPDSYAFPHRTFQEYLAGCYINRQKATTKRKLLVQIAGEGDFWDIVYKMAIEERYHIGQDPDLAELAFQLCEQGQLENERGQRLLYWSALLGELLGTQAILAYDEEELGLNNGSQYLDQIRGHIFSLLSSPLPPVERVEAGNALAALGDPRFREDLFHLPEDDMLGLIKIPAGKFWMGSDDHNEEEKPYHQCEIPYEFYMARYPTTVAQWSAYAKAADFPLKDDWQRFNHISNHPVVWVDWDQALAYCGWLNTVLPNHADTPQFIRQLLREGWQFCPPSEAEWEKAARGTDGSIYPYGNDFDENKGNTNETGIGSTSPVGCFFTGRSPYECEEMSGNVWEWTRSIFKDYGKHGYNANDGREKLEGEGDRVLRGGSFNFNHNGARCAFRGRLNQFVRYSYIGFRVCLSPCKVLTL